MNKFVLTVALVAAFFILVFLNNTYLKGNTIDLTEGKVYSLSQGSKSLIGELSAPIELTLYFSNESTKGMTLLRNYADQVESLLREYEAVSKGKITLKVVDPSPFSVQEDEATAFGLTPAPIDNSGNTAFFGLVGRLKNSASNDNTTSDEASANVDMIIPFFDPSKESLLEYDVSKLLYQLSSPDLVKLTIVSDLPLSGGRAPMTGAMTAPNVIYTQLSQFFDVNLISNSAQSIPDDTQLLMVIHPQRIDTQLAYQIDQYLMAGKKALFFIDPHFESDSMAMGGAVGENSSDDELLASYGIQLHANQVVLDAFAGLDIRNAAGEVVRHMGFLGLGAQHINREDVTTADLESINGASFGALSIKPKDPRAGLHTSSLKISPLLTSSQDSNTIDASEYASNSQPEKLAREFSSNDQTHVLAARFTGTSHSRFSAKPDFEFEQAPDNENTVHLSKTDKMNIVVFADVDMLIDRFWVQQDNFFGQAIITPFANNGDLIINIAENMSGSEGLIGVRSRGKLARPFSTVEALEVQAETKFRAQQQRLQTQLEQTELQLSELQTVSGDVTSLSPEQEMAIADFNQKRIEIRQSLRDVQFQLDKDINALENKLKLLNIAVAPLVLVVFLWGLFALFRRKSPF